MVMRLGGSGLDIDFLFSDPYVASPSSSNMNDHFTAGKTANMLKTANVDCTYYRVSCRDAIFLKAFKVKGQIYSFMKERLNCINLSLFNCYESCLLYTA